MKQDESMDEEIRPSAFFPHSETFRVNVILRILIKKNTSFSPTILDYSIFALEI